MQPKWRRPRPSLATCPMVGRPWSVKGDIVYPEGQRQRVAIARAVLKDAPLLILDEATSAVDNETEAALQRSIQRISQGRTAIVIAHRLSTVRHADRILVLENGAVVEDGTHDDLVARGGVYARLWSVQTGDV